MRIGILSLQCAIFAVNSHKMRKQELYEQTIAYFKDAMPVAEKELDYDSPSRLLVAVILSAQCTDKRVNMVTPRLMYDYPTAEAMSLATPEVIFEYIKSVSYPNNKARHLVGMAQMLVRRRGTRHTGGTGTPAWGWAQDGQRHPVCSVGKSCLCCRHACVPCEPPHRPGARTLQSSLQCGEGTHAPYPRRTHSHRPSLAYSSWTLHLHCPQTQV